MKNKIKQFAKGNFQVKCPEVFFPETHLELLIGEGEVYKGSFCIESRQGGVIRGLVYPSSFRINCLESGFEGESVEVKFTYDARGLAPGFVERGNFTIVCNGGEYDIAFTAIIEKPFVMTSFGKVQSLKDFKELAQKDFGEAHRLFRAREFYDVLKYEEKRIYSLYDNMRKWSLGEQAMEEFLVGTKQKERIFLSFHEEEREFENLLESAKDELWITKNTWGYLDAKIRTEGDFIQMSSSSITIDDFVANQCCLSYIIDHSRLHGGYNYGRIYVETLYEVICCEITVHQVSLKPRRERDIELRMAQVLKGYLGVEAGKRALTAWTDEAVSKIQELRELDSENELYKLILAHVYLKGQRKEEARWLLENYDYKKSELGKTPKLALYYLYLMVLLDPEEERANKVTEEMHRVYAKSPKDWQIAVMLTEIDPQYKNVAEKLKVLEDQFEKGANGIWFYLQAYHYYQERPDYLRKLGRFEIQVLNFAAKYQLLDEETALHTAELVCQAKWFNRNLYVLLIRCYKKYNSTLILSAICSQLISGNKTESVYHGWYAKAIEEELKIAQLYEYFMLSLDAKRAKGPLPRMIYLYFLHGNTLNYEKTALLYANVITYEPEESEIYEAYREKIEEFAWEQLEKRRINEELRIIYRRFCNEEGITPVRLQALHEICHAYRVTTTKNNMKYVLVMESDGSISQKAAYDKEEGAIVYLHHKDSRIVWEGKNGWHYADSVPFESIRLFYEQKFLELCKYYTDTTRIEAKEKEDRALSFENLSRYGLDRYEEETVFCLCSKKIREENYQESDFLSYLCYELFMRGQYDKVTLTYLANYYCGATKRMKQLWHTAKKYEVNTKKIAERIITQMLYSETMYHEEQIFLDYYEGMPYFRIKQAYLAYVSHEYVVKGRIVAPCIFQIIEKEYEKEETLADICKIALLKFYAPAPKKGKEELLRVFMRELSMRGIVFPFYLSYPEEWLREVQLFDKILIQYVAKPGSKVKLQYQIVKEDLEGPGFESEILIPTYENIYVKAFTLYKDEKLRYFFRETAVDGSSSTEKRTYVKRRWIHAGKYGKLNDMALMQEEAREAAMTQYALEDTLADELFRVY